MAPVEAAEGVATVAPTAGSSVESIVTSAPTAVVIGEDTVELVITTAPTLDEDAATIVPTSTAYWDLPELEFVRWDDAPGDIPLGLCQGMLRDMMRCL